MSDENKIPFRRECNLSRRNFSRASSTSFSPSSSTKSSSSTCYLIANSFSSLESPTSLQIASQQTESLPFSYSPAKSSNQIENNELQQQEQQQLEENSILRSSTAASVRELRLHFESLLPADRILFKTGKFLSASQPTLLDDSVKNYDKIQVIPITTNNNKSDSLKPEFLNFNLDADADIDEDVDANCADEIDKNQNFNEFSVNSVTIPEITVEDFRNVKNQSGIESNLKNKNLANADSKIISNMCHDFPRNFRSTHRPKTELIATTNHPVIGKYYSYHHKGKYDSNICLTATDETKSTAIIGNFDVNQIKNNENEENEENDDIIYRNKCDQFIHPILEELIKTEETYIDNLLNGIKNYGKIFYRKDIPMGLRGKKYVLFGNIEQIVEFHRDEFLPMLKRNRGDLKRLFDEFSIFIDENCFYGYVIFTMNKKKSLKLCEIYKQYFKKIQNEVNDKLGINSFLVQPIQRMARYPLLLQQFITTLFKNRDYVFKPIIESCCRLEKKLRNLLITANESEIINDIVECNEFNVFYQGKFLKVSEFYVFDHTLKRGYHSKVFIFEKCVVYTEIRDKNLIFRGCYPCEKIGIHSKTKSFTLFYQKRKIQECDFMGDAGLIEIWLELMKNMICSFIKEEKIKLKEKYSRDSDQVHLGPQSFTQFRNSNRFSSDSGIGNMWNLPKPESENRYDLEQINQTTWYTES